MTLSLRDKLALIYTSAGSMRGVAALVGVSHQKIGRILHSGEPGHKAVSDRVLKDPGLIEAVKVAFLIHKEITRGQALVDGLPFSNAFPVYAERLLRSMTDTYVDLKGNKKAIPMIDPRTGKQVKVKGDRVETPHIHWLSNKLRDAWISDINKARKFVNVSFGSDVNFKKYNAAAQRIAATFGRGAGVEDSARNLMISALGDKVDPTKLERMTTAQLAGAVHRLVEDGRIGRIFTRYTPMLGDAGGDPSPRAILEDFNIKLKEKHEPATGDPGTSLATTALFQIDTRNGKDDEFRKKHKIPARSIKGPGAARYAKSRGNKKRR